MTTTGQRRRPGDRPVPRDRPARSDGLSALEASRARRGRRTETERKQTGKRPERRKELRRRWVALLCVLTVVGGVYVLYFTSTLGVHTVDVVGAKNVTADQIRAVAGVPAQEPMLRVDTDQIRDRVAAMPGIATVDVSRSLPSTVQISVTERIAIAFFDSGPGGDGYHLVDGGGVVFKTIKDKPSGLPELKLPKVSVDDPVTRAVTAVLGIVPPQLLKQVTTATAKTPGSVEFTLTNGKTVRWGNAEQTDRKAKVLAALLTQDGKVYDVSAPELPTIS
ncbi:MAG: cell division protein FtsQ [Amycolatopsis sp.]|jgi:cell division protein FtsQ|uniref:cell division protein FtsQ/DivIB n=1 Tax=Amycolatopsis sp. TaxID=37632 RepID=UPI0026189A40|nr:FtsQ-type POTRA domain-containing protein [Amycolatopsis sp.]MCU1680470.1 cell division protein FtsQ [Amycolatopsis sp.]